MKYCYAFVLFACLLTACLSIASCVTVEESLEPRIVHPNDRPFNNDNLARFEHTIESLRKQFNIPGLSVGIVHNRQLAWYHGFGYADVENKIAPDTNTVFQVASVTKTFGSLILMQLVEEGELSLDDPIQKYKIKLGGNRDKDPRIKVKHLLTHTATGRFWNGHAPGINFRYNGDHYAALGKVIQKASGHSFAELLMQNVINPLQLKYTVPSTDDSAAFALTGYDKATFLKQVAKPYDYHTHKLNPVKYKYQFSPAAGLMSSVGDLAIYSMAIDEQLFLEPKTWDKTFTNYGAPFLSNVPYGLGWFVGNYDGIRVMYHTGWWYGYSALFLKVPDKDLTFIALANSQDLTRPFYLTMYPVPLPWFGASINKNLMVSDFARTFFDHFVR